jgi:hypothetical protein
MLAKAAEADESARGAVDGRIKDAWMKIADNYRSLARTMSQLEGTAYIPKD